MRSDRDLRAVDRIGGDELLHISVGPFGERLSAPKRLLVVIQKGEVALPVIFHVFEVPFQKPEKIWALRHCSLSLLSLPPFSCSEEERSLSRSITRWLWTCGILNLRRSLRNYGPAREVQVGRVNPDPIQRAPHLMSWSSEQCQKFGPNG